MEFLVHLKTSTMSDTKPNKPTDPIKEKGEVDESKDPRIDQDVPGFPHHPSKEEDIKKKKEGDKKVQPDN